MAAPEPQAASPAPAYIPVVTDLWRLARAPFLPKGVFAEQRDRPTLWIPWLLLVVLWLVVLAALLPLVIQFARNMSASAGRPLPDAAIGAIRIQVLAVPTVILVVGALLAAGVYYVVLVATGVTPRFKGLLSVSVFSSSVALLQTLVTVITLRVRGADAIQTPSDLQVSFGLDLLFPVDFVQAHPVLGALLRGIGPFQIWALVITVVGLMTLERVPRGKAWTAALTSYAVGLLIAAVLVLALRRG